MEVLGLIPALLNSSTRLVATAQQLNARTARDNGYRAALDAPLTAYTQLAGELAFLDKHRREILPLLSPGDGDELRADLQSLLSRTTRTVRELTVELDETSLPTNVSAARTQRASSKLAELEQDAREARKSLSDIAAKLRLSSRLQQKATGGTRHRPDAALVSAAAPPGQHPSVNSKLTESERQPPPANTKPRPALMPSTSPGFPPPTARGAGVVLIFVLLSAAMLSNPAGCLVIFLCTVFLVVESSSLPTRIST